jgi:SAM-dependent methyltransferase
MWTIISRHERSSLMIQDPTDQYIKTILGQVDLTDLEVLEIGCGSGRITRDLAGYCRRVLATDPDRRALDNARTNIVGESVAFMQAPTGVPVLPAASFDVVIYTLSLHHVPIDEMSSSLSQAARLLRDDGVILIIEPGDEGSFMEAKQRFGVGSGDERPLQEAALRAMQSLEGWEVGETVHFRTLFQFTDEEDFFASKVPGYRQMPETALQPIRDFLGRHKKADGIFLDSGRRLNVLRKNR